MWCLLTGETQHNVYIRHLNITSSPGSLLPYVLIRTISLIGVYWGRALTNQYIYIYPSFYSINVDELSAHVLYFCSKGDSLSKKWQICQLGPISSNQLCDMNGLNILPFWSQAMDVLSSNGTHSKQIWSTFPNVRSYSIRNIHI